MSDVSNYLIDLRKSSRSSQRIDFTTQKSGLVRTLYIARKLTMKTYGGLIFWKVNANQGIQLLKFLPCERLKFFFYLKNSPKNTRET